MQVGKGYQGINTKGGIGRAVRSRGLLRPIILVELIQFGARLD